MVGSVQRFLFPDALRGLAASWVVLYHASEGRHLGHLREVLPIGLSTILFDWGLTGVPIFFVLSGFVIAHSLDGRRMCWQGTRSFLLRRVLRLTPPYYASIALVLVLALVSARVKREPFVPPSLERIAANMLYLQDFFGVGSLNPIYWTLAIEMQFYLSFCALLAFAQWLERRRGDSVLLVSLATAVLASPWPIGLVSVSPWPGSFLPTWHAFVLGVFAYWAAQRRLHPVWLFLYAAVLGTFAAANARVFTLAAVPTALLLYLSAIADRGAQWLDWRPLQFLGRVSYSLYLTHNPVSGALFFIGYAVVARNAWTEAASLVVVFCGCTVFAWIFYRLFELPSARLSYRVPYAARGSTDLALAGVRTQEIAAGDSRRRAA